MSGFFQAPTFTPAVPPIQLGTAGQVLTMVGGIPVFAGAAGGGGILAGRVAYPSPAGARNNVAPPVVLPATWQKTSRLVVTLAGGNANWTGLLAGADGQLLFLTNADPVSSLELNVLNAGSLAANQFLYQFDVILGPGVSKLLCYDATLANWLFS